MFSLNYIHTKKEKAASEVSRKWENRDVTNLVTCSVVSKQHIYKKYLLWDKKTG